MKNEGVITYKKLMSRRELVDHLVENKNIIYKTMNKEQAMQFLSEYNYINVISPFKYSFCDSKAESISKRSLNNICKDDFGKQVYSKETDFYEYVDFFKFERSNYLPIYNAISRFELMFKTQVFYHFMYRYSINNDRDAANAFSICIEKVGKIKLKSSGGTKELEYRKDKIRESLTNNMKKVKWGKSNNGELREPLDIYLLFDRMYLKDLLNVFYTFRPKDKKSIFDEMSKSGLGFNLSDHTTFEEKIFNLVPIRNCIMHFNSLEILLNYSEYRTKTIRQTSSQREYRSIIDWLIYTGERRDND